MLQNINRLSVIFQQFNSFFSILALRSLQYLSVMSYYFAKFGTKRHTLNTEVFFLFKFIGYLVNRAAIALVV